MNRRTAILKPANRWRLAIVLGALLCLGVALIGRLVVLQVLPGVDRGYEFLQNQGDVRSISKAKIPASRGIISDRNGESLAVSTPVISIYANPRHLDKEIGRAHV